MKISLVPGLLLISLSAFSAEPKSGPFLHKRTPLRIASYTKEEKKAIREMSASELASLGISRGENGGYVDSNGNAVSGGSERTVTTPGSSFNGMATIGRYLYTGPVPKFKKGELELFASKTALTLRAKGWASTEMINSYRFNRLYRWKVIHDDFQNSVLSFEKLQDPQKVLEKTKSADLKAWLKVAMQYMFHGFEASNVGIYDSESESNADYTKKVLTAILRNFMGNPTMEIEDGLALYAQLSTPEGRLADIAASRELFMKSLGESFTADSSRPGYEGFLTIVFPIAASTKGPFSIPAEQVVQFGTGTFVEARQHSNKWGDEFGGLPFMEVHDGVGAHGPITSKAGLDAWFLRRGYVSHGCFRMDASDVQELRAMLPVMKTIRGVKGVTVPFQIMAWPDVTDWNNDGKVEAIDVGYYEIPTSVNAKSAETFMMPNVQARYWRQHFSVLQGKVTNAETKEKATFDLATGTFQNLPRYEAGKGGSLKRVGTYGEVPIHTFANRKTNIIQYRDASVKYNDGRFDDNAGEYSPKRYNDLSFSGALFPAPPAPVTLPVAAETVQN